MYINTVQLASCHLHGDTCNKNNIDKIDITLLCIFCTAYPFQKRDIRKPTHSFKEAWQRSEFHSAHQTQSCLGLHNFMSFLHWDLKSLIALSENLFIKKSLAVIQTYNRFFQSGSFTGKTYRYITFYKAEKIMLWVWLDNAIITNHRPIQDTMRKLLRKRPMSWPPEDNKSKQQVLSFPAKWLQN